MNQVVQTPEQQYYLSKLLRYDYIISYKPGNTNKVADTLSIRDSSSKSQILILCVPIYDFLNQILAENAIFSNNDIFRHTNNHPIFKCINSIIYHKGKPVLGKHTSFKPFFCRNSILHHLVAMGDSQKMYSRLSSNIFWEYMKMSRII